MQSEYANIGEKMVKGAIFNIQRYSLHDGPGIRTVIFLKGCSLNCMWCSNPESIWPQKQLIYTESKCIYCYNCVKTAPDNLITVSDGKLIINFEALNKRDLSWVSVCPTEAMSVEGELVNSGEIFREVMKDEIYFRNSGGGITLSGGEALLQPKFARELLYLFTKENISTAVETAGNVPFSSLELVAPWVSLFIYDFKVFNSEIHKKYIGHDNSRIKENLIKLSEIHNDILVRMPLIPDVNDDEENLLNTMDFLSKIGIDRLSLLPFHQYGKNKYKSIGKEYKFEEYKPPSNDHVEKLNNIILSKGFKID